MRRSAVMCVLMISLLLSGCQAAGDTKGPQEQALVIRGEYLDSAGCKAKMDVTADYGQRVYTYTLDVSVTQEETVLTVAAPQELAGITARMNGEGSRLEYDGAMLETGLLDEDGLTPLSAVPVLLESARSGFMDSCTLERLGEQETLRVLCRDPECSAGQGRETTLWFHAQTHALVRGEIAVDGYRVLLCDFLQFSLL